MWPKYDRDCIREQQQWLVCRSRDECITYTQYHALRRSTYADKVGYVQSTRGNAITRDIRCRAVATKGNEIVCFTLLSDYFHKSELHLGFCQ